MTGMQIMVFWLTQNPLTTAALCFGGGAVAVALYTYLHDYKMLTNRG